MVGKTAGSVELSEQFLQGFELGNHDRARLWDTKLPGFGVTIGKCRVTFVVQRRVNGEQRTVVLGYCTDPNLAKRRNESGPTLNHAFKLHLARMRADKASESSTDTIERERDRYLREWLERRLRTIERTQCRELNERITSDAGPYVAHRLLRHIRAAWNSALKEHDLPANPTVAVHWNKKERRQQPPATPTKPATKQKARSKINAADEFGTAAAEQPRRRRRITAVGRTS